MTYSRHKIWIYLSFFLFVGLISCRTAKNSYPVKKKAPDTTGFYSEYAKKLGVVLSGTEDKQLVKEINSWVGVPYKSGGDTKKGTDCSGFVQAVYKTVYQVSLYRTVVDLLKNCDLIKKEELSAGDLVFFKINNTQVSHVGIYINEDKFIHASSSKGVMVSDLKETYYKKYFYSGGRIKSVKKKLKILR